VRSATKKRTGKDPEYLKWIRSLPCVCCQSWEDVCQNPGPHWQGAAPTEAAHVGERGLSQRAPDRTAIPLCVAHHREGKESAHKLQKQFWNHWGIDRDKLIAELVSRFEEEHGR
jgi:hypothetical protein